MNKENLLIIKNKIFYFIPIISSLLFYFVINIINIIFFKINLLSSLYIIPDILFSIFLGYILFLFSKKVKIFFIIQFFLLAIIHIGDSLKSSFFGAPIIIDDLFSTKEAFIALWMVNPIFVILPLVLIFIIILVLILNFKFRKSGLILFLTFLTFIVSLNIFPKQYNLFINKLDKTYLFWDQQENYKHNGPFIYFINQYIRSNNNKEIPTKQSVETALQNIDKQKLSIIKPSTIKTFPNIYFILTESLWDPKLLKNSNYSQDPFYKDFRGLMDEQKNYLVSPTFEGKTADPELELLCGMPVLKNNIPFQTELKNNLECLPKIFSELGYETNAFHADWSTFYNRDKVYKKIGFNNYYSIEDYQKDDLNDGKLSDKSFLNQSYNIANKNKDQKPKFNYFLTISSHIPYLLNGSRPRIIDNNMANGWIDNYSNAIYYTTKEISEFIEKIKKDDPNSIIIVTGDHLPFLGNNKEVYTQTNTLNELTLHSTPLLFLENGKTKKTNIANMYNFGEQILNTLGINKQNTLFDLFNSEELINTRSLYVDQSSPKYININNGEKSIVPNKLQDYTIIYNDLLFGKQYSIEK